MIEKQIRVLVVDDDLQVCRLAANTLRLAGYDAQEAHSGQEAIQCCSQADSPIRLVLADVVMPKMSGRQLASQLMASHPDLKILLMSGYPSFSDFLGSLASRSESAKIETNFIKKPFDPADLISRVRDVLQN